MFKKRLGPNPHDDGNWCPAADECPDIWELDNGDFAIIGLKGNHLKSLLPPDAKVGKDEEIVILPRMTLLLAKKDIPAHD